MLPLSPPQRSLGTNADSLSNRHVEPLDTLFTDYLTGAHSTALAPGVGATACGFPEAGHGSRPESHREKHGSLGSGTPHAPHSQHRLIVSSRCAWLSQQGTRHASVSCPVFRRDAMPRNRCLGPALEAGPRAEPPR